MMKLRSKLQEYEKLSSFISKNYGTSLDKVDLAVKGWNWGTAKFKGLYSKYENVSIACSYL